MRSFLNLVSSVIVGLAGLVSIINFSAAMLAGGELGWLIVGWFALPVTVLIWPFISGAPWMPAFYVVLVVGGGIATWAQSESQRQEKRQAAEARKRTGGRSQLEVRGRLIHAEELPREMHAENTVALGVAALTGLMEGDPPSPLLNFKATEQRIWTLNPDGTLYARIEWKEIRGAAPLDETSWTVTGNLWNGLFHWMRLEPMTEYREAFADLLVRKRLATPASRSEG